MVGLGRKPFEMYSCSLQFTMITQYLMCVYVSVVGEQIYQEILSGAESFV